MKLFSALTFLFCLFYHFPGIPAQDVKIKPKFENNVPIGGTCSFIHPTNRKEYTLTLANFVQTKRPGITDSEDSLFGSKKEILIYKFIGGINTYVRCIGTIEGYAKPGEKAVTYASKESGYCFLDGVGTSHWQLAIIPPVSFATLECKFIPGEGKQG